MSQEPEREKKHLSAGEKDAARPQRAQDPDEKKLRELDSVGRWGWDEKRRVQSGVDAAHKKKFLRQLTELQRWTDEEKKQLLHQRQVRKKLHNIDTYVYTTIILVALGLLFLFLVHNPQFIKELLTF